MNKAIPVLVSAIILLAACSASSSEQSVQDLAGFPALDLQSAAFDEGGSIPARYSCDGEEVSPPLAWSDPPTATQSFALIMDDPDAPLGVWVHWVVYNIPADVRSLSEGAAGALPGGSRHGVNSWNKEGYGGPCPPRGAHRYIFTLYALDTLLEEDGSLDKGSLLDAMEGHILAAGQLVGNFAR